MSVRHSAAEIISASPHYSGEQQELRRILLSLSLEETVKWGSPCYTYRGKNVVGIGGFKQYFGLWFFQGALLKDSSSLLINAQEGKTKALRQWRMKSASDIDETEIRSYVKEAIRLVESGQAVSPNRNPPLAVPPELEAGLKRTRGAQAAFRTLTPGRQREYARYVADAKRETTRASRVEKILAMILAGVGLNDRYR
jgi:uncharacterized protein YdeI (YjbR/CyaY-like superfamily)